MNSRTSPSMVIARSYPVFRNSDHRADNCRADWGPEESEVPLGSEGGTTHLWEESWDDDDTSDDFSKQLK